MARTRAALLCAVIACGPKQERIGEDLDTAGRIEHSPRRCSANCQSAHWVDREVVAALTDISVCLVEPTYAPAGLRGAITVSFRDLPCQQAVARVAAAAGLETVVSTVNGQRAVLLRASRRPGETMVLLKKGDGWQDGGGAGGGDARGGPARRGSCVDGCAAEMRSCKATCDWNDGSCMRSCEDRYRHCAQSCS